MKFTYPSGSIPLDLDEIQGIKPQHISKQNKQYIQALKNADKGDYADLAIFVIS